MRFLKSLLRGLAVVATLGALTIVNAATDFGLIASNTPMYTAADVDAAFQPLDPDLTSIAGLTTTAHGLGLLDDADPAASRATLGLVLGTNVQPWDADLDAVAALTTNSYGLGLLQTTTNAGARTYLGLGTAATQSSGAFATASHVHAATDITSGSLDGDRLPALSTTKRGGVAATGTPSGKFLRDDDTWASPSSGGVSDGDYGDITVSGTGATWTVDSGAVAESELSVTDITTNNVSTSAHGFVPKAPNNAALFLCGDATWAGTQGRLFKVTKIAAGTTSFTPDSGTLMMVVEVWAAGGGGGGGDGGSSQYGVGGGGGSGQYAKVVVSTMRSAYTTSVPNGGAGGAAGNNAGSQAAVCSFKDTGTSGTNLSIICESGFGGLSMAAGTTFTRAGGGNAGGAGGGGSVTGSDAAGFIRVLGSVGGAGIRTSGTVGWTGAGPGAPVLGGSTGVFTGSGAGQTNAVEGGGGSGGVANTTTDRAGGNGGPGYIVVWEYK